MPYKENYPSALLTEAVEAISSLPGVGRRSALRLALHLLKQPAENVHHFTAAIDHLRDGVCYCSRCGMISDDGVCPVCDDRRRDTSVVCVVESLRDVLSIEKTGQYNGLYHILGGIISPIDGVGPVDLNINALCTRLEKGGIDEVVMALSTSMEGETTAYYLYKQISRFPVKVTAIARGVGFGDDLEYTDELTLGRSITNRQPFKP